MTAVQQPDVDCPLCRAPGSMLEHLNNGWIFCNGCARCYQLDADGTIVQTAVTPHAPKRQIQTDVSGNLIDGP